MKPRYINKDGFIDYNDLTTQSTPIAYTTGTIKLTCDGAGPYSTSVYKPMGVTSLWNTVTNQFNFTELNVGDEITLRFDITVTTKAVGQVIRVFCTFDIGGFPYDLTLEQQYFKSVGTYQIVETEKFYIGSLGMRNNPGEIKFTSENNDDADIVVNGFYISVHRR